MKRSERLLKTARHEAAMAILFLTAGVAAGVWAVAAAQAGTLPGGTALTMAAVIALSLAATRIKEAIRTARLSDREARWDWERGIRPRI